MKPGTLVALLGLTATACARETPAPLYQVAVAERRDIVVSASAAGVVEPILTVDVKSLASGEIIEMRIETGDAVRAGQLLARVDPRQPRNQLAQADANLVVARAQLENARAQLTRADTLFKTQAITEAEYENARLTFASANAQVVRAEADLELARDQMDDTQVRAPIGGTIIQRYVALGTVISSPTRDVGGGTVLFQMANLDTVQIRALVDETDIGKAQPGLPVTIEVQAYPARPFRGTVLKIEPQATVQQNVTMFPVLVRIVNPEHLLKPGMNAEVEIHVGQRTRVVAIPYAALRTPRDVGSAAEVLGLDPAEVQRQLAAAPTPSADSTLDGAPAAAGGRGSPELPPGVTAEQVREIMRKRMSGGDLTPADEELLRRVRATDARRQGDGERATRRAARPTGDAPGSYVVFTLRAGRPLAVPIRTGLTDLDYIEVLDGLAEGDTVLLLPSASLVQSQRELRERVQRFTGGGLPGVQQQTTPRAPAR